MRTKEAQAAYDAYRTEGGLDNGCRLCEAPSKKEFEHWRIIENKFPYDLVASVHDMAVPKVHGSEREISAEAWREFQDLKVRHFEGDYDFYVEAAPKRKTIPAHYHMHLIVVKPQV